MAVQDIGMVRVIGSLVFGGLILLLASSNAHMVETRFGPLIMLAPHFVVLGITFFLGFAIGIVLVFANVMKRRKHKLPGKNIVIKR
ncbi:magnetosome protein MamL [Magnetospirillum gryphiswaldense]|nr:magnetosome protein MamL [Magnetospirillum gryphiswaldense]